MVHRSSPQQSESRQAIAAIMSFKQQVIFPLGTASHAPILTPTHLCYSPHHLPEQWLSCPACSRNMPGPRRASSLCSASKYYNFYITTAQLDCAQQASGPAPLQAPAGQRSSAALQSRHTQVWAQNTCRQSSRGEGSWGAGQPRGRCPHAHKLPSKLALTRRGSVGCQEQSLTCSQQRSVKMVGLQAVVGLLEMADDQLMIGGVWCLLGRLVVQVKRPWPKIWRRQPAEPTCRQGVHQRWHCRQQSGADQHSSRLHWPLKHK